MMTVTQVRMPDGLMKEVDKLVNKGLYANKSDAVRDAVRKMIMEKYVGIIPDTGDSVKEIREIRKILSKQKHSLKELNQL
jgi:hypothetical protein